MILKLLSVSFAKEYGLATHPACYDDHADHSAALVSLLRPLHVESLGSREIQRQISGFSVLLENCIMCTATESSGRLDAFS